jgi:hypothetical protein
MSESVADIKKFSHDALSTQLAYRRDRRHSIFAWCSTIFVAIIGGVVATVTKSESITPYQQGIITSVTVVLASFTVYWIGHHWKIEKEIQIQIDNIYTDCKIYTSDRHQYHADWMQTLAVLGLSGTALLAIWWKEIGWWSVIVLGILGIVLIVWNRKEIPQWWSQEVVGKTALRQKPS